MNLIDQAQGGEVVAPRICFVCEHHFDEHHRFVDTGHSVLTPEGRPPWTHLAGVKYICEHCAITAASTVMGTDLRELANELMTLQRQVDVANDKLREFDGMDAAVVEQVKRIAGTRVEAKKGPRPGNQRGGARKGTDRHGNPKPEPAAVEDES